MGNEIGYGAYSKVCRASFRENQMAVKIINLEAEKHEYRIDDYHD